MYFVSADWHTSGMGKRQSQQELQSELDFLEALLVITYQVFPAHRHLIDTYRRMCNSLPNRKLRQLIAEIRDKRTRFIKRVGYLGTPSLVTIMLKHVRSQAEGSVCIFPKWALDQAFKRYGDCFPNWDKFPAHAMIPLDKLGDWKFAIDNGVYVPEAILYEDMCAAYNLAVESQAKERPDTRKVHKKNTSMLVRSTVLAAYYFVEAYLNAVAFNYWWAQKTNLAQGDIDTLLEFDSKNKRTRWISFEEKTQKYPRIILGAQHCPLQPTNCAELGVTSGATQGISRRNRASVPKTGCRSNPA